MGGALRDIGISREHVGNARLFPQPLIA